MDNPSEPASAPGAGDFVTLAQVIKTQGRRGELAAEILTDLPSRFEQVSRVFLLSRSGRRQAFKLERHWFHKGWVVLQLAGLGDLNAAGEWVGAQVQVPAAERPPAPVGSFFLDELAGCELLDRGRSLGTVAAVELIPGGAPLLRVSVAAGREILVPFAQPYLESVSVSERRIRMRLPEGLLEIE